MASRRPHRTVVKVILAGILSTLLSIVGSFVTHIIFATSPLPTSIAPYAPFAIPTFGVVLFLSLCVAIWQIDPGSSPAAHPNSSNSIDLSCPFCHQPGMRVHGNRGDSVFLECDHCHKTVKATYSANQLVKLFIPTVGVIVGTAAIANYLDGDPGTIADIFSHIFENLLG